MTGEAQVPQRFVPQFERDDYVVGMGNLSIAVWLRARPTVSTFVIGCHFP
jgi:hypothetical protein